MPLPPRIQDRFNENKASGAGFEKQQDAFRQKAATEPLSVNRPPAPNRPTKTIPV